MKERLGKAVIGGCNFKAGGKLIVFDCCVLKLEVLLLVVVLCVIKCDCGGCLSVVGEVCVGAME